MSGGEGIKMTIKVDEQNLKELIKKYPAIKGTIEKQIEYWLERFKTKPFEEGIKNIWFPEIKDSINFINTEKIKKNKRKNNKIKTIEKTEVEFHKAIKWFSTKKDLATKFVEIQPLYYDNYKIWWMWNLKEYKWEMIDETDILNAISLYSFANTINSKEKTETIEALKQVARLNKPKEIKKSWVQFGDIIYDIETDKNFKANPKYFVSNPIPYCFGKSEDTPEIDKLFKDWLGKEDVKELYEIIAFSIVPNYFIHRIICLIGSGANGKSTYLDLISKFLGENNMTTTSLDSLLGNRFAGAKLLKKLVCIMGETNYGTISRTEYIKRLSGGVDMIDGEIKNKNPFNFINYAKLIIATNSLPMTTDKTEGFYRRWRILEFNNLFEIEKDVLKDIPENEYENLALKTYRLCKELWKNRIFTNEGNFKERKRIYEEKSNPIMIFINQNYEKDIKGEVEYGEFVESFSDYLTQKGYRLLSRTIISRQLKAEGFEVKKKNIDIDDGFGGTKKTSINYIIGLSLNKNSSLGSKEKEGNKLDNTDNTDNTGESSYISQGESTETDDIIGIRVLSGLSRAEKPEFALDKVKELMEKEDKDD